MNNTKKYADPYDSFGSAFHHVLFERKEMALTALTGGFILGGSILLILTAHLVAYFHGSVYIGITSVTAEAILLLRLFWLMGQWMLQTVKIKRWTTYPLLFALGFRWGLLLPLYLVKAGIEIWIEDRAARRTPKQRVQEKQDMPHPLNHMFSRMAHIS